MTSLATVSEKLLYIIGIISSIGAGTILPLMTLIFGNTITVFTDFATGAVEGAYLRHKINYYT
jgi:ATP-binding cassette, subfamily B (MDR/TAP), member 1